MSSSSAFLSGTTTGTRRGCCLPESACSASHHVSTALRLPTSQQNPEELGCPSSRRQFCPPFSFPGVMESQEASRALPAAPLHPSSWGWMCVPSQSPGKQVLEPEIPFSRPPGALSKKSPVVPATLQLLVTLIIVIRNDSPIQG